MRVVGRYAWSALRFTPHTAGIPGMNTRHCAQRVEFSVGDKGGQRRGKGESDSRRTTEP